MHGNNQNIDVITEIDAFDHLHLRDEDKGRLEKICSQNPMRVTPYYNDLIDWDDPDDPIRKMAIPSLEEESDLGDWDTSGEQAHTKTRSLQHKYQETALILTTHECAMYCRFCFRKRLVGLEEQETLKSGDFDRNVEYIRAHPEITNVLITGGDPLTLKWDVLASMIVKLDTIPHLRYIRIGTRLPVVNPSAVYRNLELAALRSCTTKPLYIVTHFNHPKELSEESRRALKALREINCIISNQTVLLRGINDSPDILTELMRGLVGASVVPYYLFQCRPTKHATHFQIPLLEGIRIVRDAKSRLDGHAERFRFVMSHKTGKVEVLGGVSKGKLLFRYHECKIPELTGKIFERPIEKEQYWLRDEQIPEEAYGSR